MRYFRIYRDACCCAGRPLRPDGDERDLYIDPSAPSGLHRYWVTAVGPGISESQPSNSFDWLVP